MKNKISYLIMSIILTSTIQAYLIQGVDLDVAYWAGSGENECIIAVDWNATNGPYQSAFHLFGFRWEPGTQVTVKEAVEAIDAAGDLLVTYAYGGGYINHMQYDRISVDGDVHTSLDYGGWWWAGQTDDGGQTWQDNEGGIDTEYVWKGGIEAFNIDGTNWGSATMTIPEPATLVILGAGLLMVRIKRSIR